MAKKYIDAEAAFNEIFKVPPKVDDDGYCWVTRSAVAARIDSILAADVVEVQHAHWEIKFKWEPLAWDTGPLDWDRYDEKTHSEEVDYYACSKCGFDGGSWKPSWTYCPNCGAKMDEEYKEKVR